MQVSKVFFNTNFKNIFTKRIKDNKHINQINNIDYTNFNQAISNINKSLIHFTGIAEDNIEEIIRMREQEGKTFKEIANKFGCQASWLYNVYNCYTADPKTNILEQNKAYIIEMYNKGKSQAKIGRKYGYRGNEIGIYLKKWGVDTRSIAERNRDLITQLNNEGYNYDTIAEEVGCTPPNHR